MNASTMLVVEAVTSWRRYAYRGRWHLVRSFLSRKDRAKDHVSVSEAPWPDASGQSLKTKQLPGKRSEVVQCNARAVLRELT